MELIFNESMAGPGINFKKGGVYSMTEAEAKPYLKNGHAKKYDDHVKEVKENSKNQAKSKKTKK